MASVPINQKERERFFGFMDGYSSMADDLPDGAWEEVCKEGVSAYNKQYGTRYDRHQAWLLWVERRSTPQKDAP